MIEEKFEVVLTTSRLNTFGRNAEEQLAAYFTNLQICEALYPLLHFVEVAWRNHLDGAMYEVLGDPNWLSERSEWRTVCGKGAIKIGTREIEKVEQASRDVRRREVSHDDLVARLSFGFWVSLADRHYDSLWPFLFKSQTFLPNLPKRHRTRKRVNATLDDVRKLRNRVMHHEPVTRDLTKLRGAILNAWNILEWIDEDVMQTINRFSMVDDVLSGKSIRSWRAK